MSYFSKIGPSRLAFVPIFVLAACSNGTGVGARKPVSVSFMSSAAGAPAFSTAPMSSSLMSPTGASFAVAADGIVLTKVQLVLSHIELERASGSCASTVAVSESECDELELVPALINVPVTPGMQTEVNATVPVGSYKEFHAKVEVVRAGDSQDGAKAFLDANPAFAGISVRVEGTYTNGGVSQAFVYTSTAKGEIETEFSPALDVTKDNMNVTVGIDVSSWFRTSSGTVINPNAAAGSTEAAMIDANIRKSFKAFEDDNKVGVFSTH